jgi:hypothetical protein
MMPGEVGGIAETAAVRLQRDVGDVIRRGGPDNSAN